MRRASDAPRSGRDETAEATAKLEELARQQGRGATAMRDRAGRIITMATGSPIPAITPSNVDAALGFDPTTNKVLAVSTDGQSRRDMGMQNADVAGDSTVQGASTVQGDSTVAGKHTVQGLMSAMAGLSVGGGQVLTGGLRLAGGLHIADTGLFVDLGGLVVVGGATLDSLRVNGPVRFNAGSGVQTLIIENNGQIVAGSLYLPSGGYITLPGGNVSTDANGSMNSKQFYGGTFNGHGNFDNGYAVTPPSSRHLKDEKRLITGASEKVRRWVPAIYEWRHPELHESAMTPGEHAGIYVEEMKETAPEVVRPFVVRWHNHPWDTEAREEPFREDEIGDTYEDRGALAYVVATVQEQMDRADRAERERDELRDRLDALERRLAALEAA